MQNFYKIECQNDDGTFFDYRNVSSLKKVVDLLVTDAKGHLDNNALCVDPEKSIKALKKNGHAFFDISNDLGFSKCFYVTQNRIF